MFGSTMQQTRSCEVLCRRVGITGVFYADGVTKFGGQIIDDVLDQRGHLSSGEQLMVRVAFDFWNSAGKAQVGEVLNVLDNGHVEAIAALMVAVVKGPDAVARWLSLYDR